MVRKKKTRSITVYNATVPHFQSTHSQKTILYFSLDGVPTQEIMSLAFKQQPIARVMVFIHP